MQVEGAANPCSCRNGPIVYGLGSRVFTPGERVRVPLGLRHGRGTVVKNCPSCGYPLRLVKGERDGKPWEGWVHASVADFLACPRF